MKRNPRRRVGRHRITTHGGAVKLSQPSEELYERSAAFRRRVRKVARQEARRLGHPVQVHDAQGKRLATIHATARRSTPRRPRHSVTARGTTRAPRRNAPDPNPPSQLSARVSRLESTVRHHGEKIAQHETLWTQQRQLNAALADGLGRALGGQTRHQLGV